MEARQSVGNLDIYFTSVILYQVGSIVRLQLESQILGNTIRIISVFLLCYAILSQLVNKNNPKLGIWAVLLLWLNTVNILASFITSGLNFTRFFGEGTYLLNYMLPYLLLFNPCELKIRKVFRWCLLFCGIAVVAVLMNASALRYASEVSHIQLLIEKNPKMSFLAQLPVMWSIPAALIFMNAKYCEKKEVVFAICVFILSICFSLAFGRRSVSLYGALFLGSAFLMYLRNRNYKSTPKFFLCCIIVLISPALILFAIDYFSFAWHRGFSDTRSAVDDSFYADMNLVDWLFGRGLNGTYYDPLFLFMGAPNRPNHETGYLNVVLHAGGIYLMVYIMLVLSIVWRTLKLGNNILVKAFALYVFLNTSLLAIGSYPDYNLRFFCLWVGIIICSNSQLLRMSEQQIKVQFFGK